jgi:ubiquinone/menaquinone biosynthesis C-methylase UbiE
MGGRSRRQIFVDGLFFPLRAVTLFEDDRWGLSALASERFDYAAREVTGKCLDVGCGKRNRFVQEYLNGHGTGVDVYPYEGLSAENLVSDLSRFPFSDGAFGSVTFIANLNHVPRSQRDIELGEAYRCLEPGGKIIVTMGNPVAEILVHQVVWFYDRFFGTEYDMDSARGMGPEEQYYLTDTEIRQRLARAGFTELRKKRFYTQWGLNHMLVGRKPFRASN